MSHPARRAALLLLLAPVLLAAGPPAAPPTAESPDPASVRRYGPAYRYPQDGWIVLHIEGAPYERGYQHGRLMTREIADFVTTQAGYRAPKSPADGWRELRLLANALFLRRFDPEYLEEMKGIADGAAAGGAKYDGRALDLLDVVALNSEIESTFLDEALDATANGLEHRRFREPAEGRPAAPHESHCSAFVATGPATADGHAMLGHITMWNLLHARHYNVWIDIKPAEGHRVLMQTYPGGIMSGMDYYMNDHGLMVCETTLDQGRFDVDGRPLAGRIRKVLQYADGIDDAVAILKGGNNGLYTNEWLMADANTDEIAMFELGTGKTRLWRSAKGDWFGGTEGFYWGCNNAKDVQVRLETVPGVGGKPANVVWHPSDRDRKWIELYGKKKGKIGVGFGFEVFTTPPLCAFPSLDAKFATAAMAKELTTYAVYGPPRGRVWEPTNAERDRYPMIGALVPNDWTLLRAVAPPTAAGKPAADLAADRKQGKEGHAADAIRPPAWRGTILPASPADTWLASAFSDYEKVVAREKAMLKADEGGTLSKADRERLDVALFGALSRYLTAVRRAGGDAPLADTRVAFDDDAWYDRAAGKGLLLLADLRGLMGSEKFDAMMDDFGQAHAGKPASTAEFFAHVEAAHGKPLKAFADAWLGGDAAAALKGAALARLRSGRFWAIDSFQHEPGRALIVYGTAGDVEANRQAAERLARLIGRQWSNVDVPIRPDSDVADADLAGHVLLVGRPATNRLAERLASALPLTFGPGSFTLDGETYAHEGTAVIAAGPNPRDPRSSVVIFAGLGADATWRCVDRLPGRGQEAGEVLLIEAGMRPRVMVVTPKEAAEVAAGE